jgi:putative flippase GtrA
VSRRTLILRYTAFAVLAVVANLATQRIVLSGTAEVDATRFALALGAGTLVGLVVKYVLDKRWIFFDETRGARAQGRQFFLYSLMGVATTAIFWVTETAFWLIWGTDLARETGAVLGLMVGYTTKYLLDRRFVFTDARGRHDALSGWGRTPVASAG